MLEGIPYVATIKGVSATDRETNDNDRYNKILEEDYPNKESNIILNIKTSNIKLDDNTSVNDTENKNLGKLLTATDDSYNTDEKEDKGTIVNNKINNTNEEENNIPLYQWAQQLRCLRRNQNLDLITPFEDVHISEATLLTKIAKLLLELMSNNKPVKNINNFHPGKGGNILKKAVKECIENKDRKVLKNYIIRFLFNQMSAKEGIKSFGNKALMASCNEFSQLHNTSTFYSIKTNRLTYKQKKQALRALLLIKEKCDRTIKGRTVENGALQRVCKSKMELA